MTTVELEQAIRDCIMDVYNKQYVGSLEIKRLNPVGLQVRLGMNNYDKPIYITAELEDKAFLKFFKEELRTRHFNTSWWFSGYKTYPDECTHVDSRCGCHDGK